MGFLSKIGSAVTDFTGGGPVGAGTNFLTAGALSGTGNALQGNYGDAALNMSTAGLLGSGGSLQGFQGGKPEPFTLPDFQTQAPQFNSLLNNENQLPTNLTASNSFDPQDVNRLRDFATSTSASPWLQLQFQNISDEAIDIREQIDKQRLGSLGSARENLAARRGLSSGACERLEIAGLEAAQEQLQKIGREVGSQRRVAEIAEQENKIGVLQNLPQMELQRAQQESVIQQTNIANILKEKQAERTAAMDTFRIESEREGNRMQALATANAESNPPGMFGGGGFLGTGFKAGQRDGRGNLLK